MVTNFPPFDGILYHQVLNRIKYGFTDEMAQQIRDELVKAGAYLK